MLYVVIASQASWVQEFSALRKNAFILLYALEFRNSVKCVEYCYCILVCRSAPKLCEVQVCSVLQLLLFVQVHPSCMFRRGLLEISKNWHFDFSGRTPILYRRRSNYQKCVLPILKKTEVIPVLCYIKRLHLMFLYICH